ncbi:MAG: hypothetical protein II640_07430 [Lachnospiraceae bacterium]|nr:hypothetical protein [Lachnospiraceae bacterium]
MADSRETPPDSRQLIANLNKQISELKSQVHSATLEMEMMRARMNDLSSEAKQVVNVERFRIPDEDHLNEINDVVELMEKAIKKERRSRKAQMEGRKESESSNPQKVDERQVLIVLKLRRKGCYIREIASHVGLGIGTVHNIISRYGQDPQMQNLVTEGTQMELTDYLLLHPDDS